MSKDFLFELGTEELPPKALKSLLKSFAESMYKQLDEAGLTYDKKASQIFASPRRLSMRVINLAEQTPQAETTVWGPPANVAFDAEGKPSKAAQAFAVKNGIDESKLKSFIKNDGKIDKLCCTQKTGGASVTQLLPGFVEQALKDLPIPKRMRWGSGKAEFVRPVHWLVMLYGKEVIPCEILGKKADRITHGHRFHAPGDLTIDEPASYQALLRNHYVEVCFKMRRDKIVAQVNAVAEKLGGKANTHDRDLLDEVTALVEWPVALAGNFEKHFLEVPKEALISSMSEHQKYFHVVDANGKLMPHFITVANLESKDPKQVIDGNERVIRPRLSDAAFFFETDKKQTLESRLEKLKTVTFQEKLGSVYDKSIRISSLAHYIAIAMGYPSTSNVAKGAERAGMLCKCDLVTKMVLEFDQMQGIAGFYYASHDGELAQVANAIHTHYLPKSAYDALPASQIACSVALADRIDTLVGIFSIGERPTGSKDPFALRRAAIGVLRIIIEHNLDINLQDLLIKASEPFGHCDISDVLQYIFDRFRGLPSLEDIPEEVFRSVYAAKVTDALPQYKFSAADFYKRIVAVNQFCNMPELKRLAEANKRVSNILAKNAPNLPLNSPYNPLLLGASDADNLATIQQQKLLSIKSNLENRDYTAVLLSFVELDKPISKFFDSVMVMDDNLEFRENRLALLSQFKFMFHGIADISHLVPEKK